MPQKPYLEAGQIVGTHGVRGEVRVQPWCDSPQQFATFKKLYWDKDGKQEIKLTFAQMPQAVGAGVQTGKAPLSGRKPINGMEQAKKRLAAMLGADAK